jgi:multiple sugar transport system substrate-binding protein
MKISYRLFAVVLVAMLLLAPGLAGCQSPTPVTVVQKETVQVEVTKIVAGTPVVEQVVVTATAGPTKPAPAAPAASGAVVIRVGTGDSGEGLSPHQQIIQNFEDQNKDIIVQLEPVAGRDYYARLLTQLAAKGAPDVMQVGDDAVPMFVSKGAFVPLDAYMKDSTFDPSIYLPGLLDPGKYQGKQYLLPKDYSPLAVYYNKKIFDAAHEPYPKEGWTWGDLLATAQRLTKKGSDGKTEIWGLQLTANWTTGFEYYVAAAGGRLISEDGKSIAGYMDSPEVIHAVQFFADMYNKYKVTPPPASLSQWAGGNQEFANGKAAMFIFGRWPQAGYLTNPNISLGLAPLPKDKVRANVLFWSGFGISSTTKYPDVSYDFLQYYTGEPGAQVWKDWALPAVKSVADSSGMSKDPINGVWINELNYLVPRAYTFTPYWNETADSALNKALQTVLLDPKADVAKVMATAAKEAQASLDKLLKK